jgi:hypothetical protein
MASPAIAGDCEGTQIRTKINDLFSLFLVHRAFVYLNLNIKYYAQ